MPAPKGAIFYRPDAYPDAQPAVLKHWRQFVVSWHCYWKETNSLFKLYSTVIHVQYLNLILGLTGCLVKCFWVLIRICVKLTYSPWGLWRWALVSPDGVAPSQMAGVSSSVNLPLHHKVQKFSFGTGSPGWSRKKGRKTVVVTCSPSSPVDNIWAIMIVWRIRGKIIRIVLCCVVYDSSAQWYAHTHEQFLKLTVSLGFLEI